jgi:hypothetical protein
MVDVPSKAAPLSVRPNIQAEFNFLIQRYGKPAKTFPIDCPSDLDGWSGLRAHCTEMNWTMPDGTSIRALEHFGLPMEEYGRRDELSIRFLSKKPQK